VRSIVHRSGRAAGSPGQHVAHVRLLLAAQCAVGKRVRKGVVVDQIQFRNLHRCAALEVSGIHVDACRIDLAGPEETVRERCDAEVEVVDLMRVHSYVAPEIVMMLNIADEFGFKVRTLQHVLEGYKVANEIRQHGAMASTFADFWGYKVEAWDAIPYNAAIMHKLGVNVSINSDDDERVTRLYEEAGRVYHYNNGELTEDDALKMITLNPAIQLGIDNRVGSIEVGKDADLVLFSAHPFSTYTTVEKTFIEGQIYFDRELDLKTQPREAAQ